MRNWLELLFALIIIIPLTQLVMSDMTTPTTGFVYNATMTSVGDDGPFVLVLFQFWPILFGLGLTAIIVFMARKKVTGWRGFGNDGEQK